MDSIYFEDSSLYLRGENIISLDEESEHDSSYLMSHIFEPSMMSPISGPSQEEIYLFLFHLGFLRKFHLGLHKIQNIQMKILKI